MTVKARKIGLFAMLVLLLACSVCILLNAGKATAVTFAPEWFTYSDATATEMQTGAGGRTGMKITGFGVGASVTARDTLVGKLELEMSAEDCGLRAFRVRISDALNPYNAFDAVVESTAGEWNVGVEAFGKRAGIYYSFGKTAFKTADNSALGVYTKVAASETGNTLCFDPADMTLSVSDGNEMRTVWNFSYFNNDGCDLGGTLDAVTRYTVSIVFDRTDGKSGLLLYAVNGQRFDTPYLYGAGVDSAAPRIFADVAVFGKANNAYKIPRGYAYDVIDGEISDVYVEAIRDGVTVLNRTVSSDTTEFTPETEGVYTLRYTAADSAGMTAVYDRSITVGRDSVVSEINYSQAALPEAVGVGSEIVLPVATVSSAQAVHGERAFAAFLTVARDGNVLADYDCVFVKAGESFVFETEGKYTFTYVSTNSQLPCEETIEVIAATEYAAISAVSVSASYIAGDTVTFALPEFSVGNDGAKATAMLKYPSGAVYAGVRHILSETGGYELVYSAIIGGKEYTYSRKFAVCENAFSVTGSSNGAYGTTPYLSSSEGLSVTLDRNGVFTYNKAVDISSLDGDTRLLQLYVTPQIEGIKEAEGVEVRLTDAHNSDNYVTIQSVWEPADRVTGNNMSYIRAGANGQVLVGHRGSNSWDFDTTVDVGNEAGRIVYLSMRGLVSPPRTEIAPFEIYYDYESKQVLVGETSFAGWNNRMVCDLDDPKDFLNPWDGFTTGEVIISVRPYRPTQEKFRFFLTEIYGEDFRTGKSHDELPVIKVNTLDYDGELPIAIVGKEYPVFAATAVAPRAGTVPVSVSAVLGYGLKSEARFDVSDGKFLPILAGEYTLVYTAVNLYGDVATETLKFTAVKENEIGDIAVSVTNTASAVCGQTYTFQEPNVTNAVGKPQIEITYKAPNGVAGTADCEFVPETIGDYILTYKATDYLGRSAVAECVLTVAEAEAPLFGDEPALPNAFAAGYTYVLPEYFATVSENGVAVKKTAEVSVKYGNTPVTVTNGAIVPWVDKSGDSLTVTYTVDGAAKSFDIPVQIAKTQDGVAMDKFFFGADIDIAAGEDGILFTARNDRAEAEYLVPLVAGTFSAEFTADGSKFAAGESFTVTLVDSENENIAVRLSVQKGMYDGDRTRLTVNGNDVVYTRGSLYGDKCDFLFSFDAALNRISDGGTLKYTVRKDMRGNGFSGFPSGKVRLYIGLESENNAVCLRTLNEQPLSDAKEDGVGPNIYMRALDKQTYSMGTRFTLDGAYAGDVLDLTLDSFTVTVRGENNQIITAVDGTKLQNVSAYESYTFELNAVGRYYIVFGAIDGAGNVNSARYTLRVSDTVKPEITLSADDLGRVNPGSAVSLPTAAAEGAKDGAVSVYVIRPDGKAILVTNGVFADTDMTGIYTVRYVAFDGSGNMATAFAVFTV